MHSTPSTTPRRPRIANETFVQNLRPLPGSKSIPNFSRVKSVQDITVVSNKVPSTQFTLKGTSKRESRCPVKLWDGINRRTTPWDGLKKDPELWFANGDCLVYFHARAQAQDIPTLRIPYGVVQNSGCLPLLGRRHFTRPGSLSSDGGEEMEDHVCRLYIPAPGYLSRVDTNNYHLTTRNLFAWMLGRPLVGTSLSQALIDLLGRMLAIRPATQDSLADVLAYTDCAGYSDMVESADHALALLNFAEHFSLNQLYTDSFVHCVGMTDILCTSIELKRLSNESHASLTREYLRMDMKLTRVDRALRELLENELANTLQGLTASQDAHLERFRSFLNTYYVAKFGYWPPPKFTQTMLFDMSYELECAYELMVDATLFPDGLDISSKDMRTYQNLTIFDAKNKCTSRVNMLPIKSKTGKLDGKALTGKTSISLSSSKVKKRQQILAGAKTDLLIATNDTAVQIRDCAFVRAYLAFELDCLDHLEADLTIDDARSMRWILIYCMLQVLDSVTSTPARIATPGSMPYPTCCDCPFMPIKKVDSMLSIHPALRSPSMTPPGTPKVFELSTNQNIVDGEDLSTPALNMDYFSRPLSSATRYSSLSPVDDNVNTPLAPAPLKVKHNSVRRPATPPQHNDHDSVVIDESGTRTPIMRDLDSILAHYETSMSSLTRHSVDADRRLDVKLPSRFEISSFFSDEGIQENIYRHSTGLSSSSASTSSAFSTSPESSIIHKRNHKAGDNNVSERQDAVDYAASRSSVDSFTPYRKPDTEFVSPSKNSSSETRQSFDSFVFPHSSSNHEAEGEKGKGLGLYLSSPLDMQPAHEKRKSWSEQSDSSHYSHASENEVYFDSSVLQNARTSLDTNDTRDSLDQETMSPVVKMARDADANGVVARDIKKQQVVGERLGWIEVPRTRC